MLDTEYTDDYTLNAEIIHEFQVDEFKRNNLIQCIEESINSCTGFFNKPKRKRLQNLLEEIKQLNTYYITDNNYLYTIVYESDCKIKYAYDLRLCFNLEKDIYSNVSNYNDEYISVLIDSTGCGKFEINEDGTEDGRFGWIDGGTCAISIPDIYETNMYSVLNQYIDEKENIQSIVSEFEID